MIIDGLVGAWIGDKGRDYAYPIWTLSVELWSSFFIYTIANIGPFYNQRFYIYGGIMAFIYTAKISDAYGITKYRIEEDIQVASFLPLFITGIVVADLEAMKKRPLDVFRT